jgi:hypothetical protein
MAPKELHFFGEDLKFGTGFYRRDFRSYMGEYAAWNGQSHGGEASVWYLFSTRAAREIHEFNPEARIIIMLREPAEVIHSLYHQFRFDANEHLRTFEEALAAEEERRQGQRICRTTYFIQGLVYREVVHYTEQVRRYFEVFGRDRVHVVIYDDFSADVEKEYQSTLDFLGLDSHEGPTTFRPINESKLIRSRALRAVLCDPCIRSLAVRASKAMGRNTFVAVRSFEQKLWRINSHAQRRVPMCAELRERLKREFAPEIERLSDLLQRDLTHWSR